MAPDTTTLTRKQVAAEGLADWEWLVGAIEARYETGGFATGLELVNRIGAAAEEADHHPDLTLTWPLVHVRLVSHDAGGVTSRDVAMARRISEIAAEIGVTPTRDKLSRVEFGLDTADTPAAIRFWAAVLGYDVDDDIAVVDPDGRQVELWFQETDSHEASARQRFHVDVSVPPDQAQTRIDAALAAGGTLRQQRSSAGVHRARRPRGQQGVRVYLAGQGAGVMDPRVSFITLAVPDLDAERAFYVDGLGWEPAMWVPDDVLMIRVGDKLLLSLWAEPGFESEVGPIRRGEGQVPITLAHNLPTREEVDAVLEDAREAGASYVGPAEEREWGGYTGYFADPAGFRWEVAYNPGPIGQTVLP